METNKNNKFEKAGEVIDKAIKKTVKKSTKIAKSGINAVKKGAENISKEIGSIASDAKDFLNKQR